jgi:hypothetical protein
LADLVFGYTQAGAYGFTAANDVQLATNGDCYINGAVFRSAPPFSPSSYIGRLNVDNNGFVDPAMVPVSTSLATNVVDPGMSYQYGWLANVYKSTMNPHSGSYAIEVDPVNTTTAAFISPNCPIDIPIVLPIGSGNNLTVTAWVKLGTGAPATNTPVLILDPEQAWFTTQTSTQQATPGGAYTQLSVSSAAPARGASKSGCVNLILRVQSMNGANSQVWWDDIQPTAS